MIKYVYKGRVWGVKTDPNLTSIISPEDTLETIIYNTLYDSIDELIEGIDIEWVAEDTEEENLYIIKVRIEPNYIKLEPTTIKVTRKVSYNYEVIDDRIGIY